jgi:ATP-binding cassette, subfamily B, vacuolar membrane transporter HMT1/ACLQ
LLLTLIKASHIAALLYYIGGLLPDPDGPWSPTVPHGSSWGAGIFAEALIGAVLYSAQEKIPLPKSLIDTLFGLGMSRILTLLLMIALLVRRQYRLRPERGSGDERQSLLENGNGAAANGYGGTNGTTPGHPAPPDRQMHNVGWLDYFAGFKVLFPYLWWGNHSLSRLMDLN